MAHIVENPNGGRRLIRLSGDDVMMIMARVQQECRQGPATYGQLKAVMASRPFYLPEDTP